MNKRIRQWLKACHRIEAHDPTVWALVPDVEMSERMGWTMRRIEICRKSQAEKLKVKYGDDMEIII